MNKHSPLPPSNVRELSPIPAVIEQYIVLRGRKETWIDGDLFTRSQVIKEIDGDYSNLAQVIAISLAAGTSRDATDEIVTIVANRWAEDGEVLSPEAKEFVAAFKGEAFANSFRTEMA